MKVLNKILSMSISALLLSTFTVSNVFAVEYPDEYKDDPNRRNCVHFVKSMMSDWPENVNLSTWQAKLNLVSDPGHGRGRDVCPEAGWMAVVDTRNSQPEGSKVGHVGYVEDASEEDGTITVVTLDAGWNGRVARRTGTPKALRIVGYWAP